MHQLTDYDAVIFDCDGVILDSNELKINAMHQALSSLSGNRNAIEESVNYFKNNFGKSRFHHIDVFAKEIFKLDGEDSNLFKEHVLKAYSEQCRTLYLDSALTPRVQELLILLSKKKLYIASGSEQQELCDVLKQRKLSRFFIEVLGSPTPKVVNVRNIINGDAASRYIMIGDAISDFEAAKENNIDFIFYAPFSNVKSKMLELSKLYGFPVISDFSEVMSDG